MALSLSGIGVRLSRGEAALADVSLTVPDGAIVGVIGPNGAGKTTLLNVVCGFVAPTTGTMSLDGAPLRPKPHHLVRLGIARTLQGVGLFDGLSVLENVMAGATRAARTGVVASLLGAPRADRDERALADLARSLLDELGLARYAGARPSTLPYALRKKVALARALAGDPRLLLLDEPAGGLSAEETDELAALLTGLAHRPSGACSVLLVEHHVPLVVLVCDEVVVLDLGRVVAAGTAARLREDRAVADAYLGAL
ncbi:MAG TPA: ATP-binding cassette domain-containing protein [Micromonosporaceae bacterium]|jgi:branched-chain amino acid transport system ATP-binding protein